MFFLPGGDGHAAELPPRRRPALFPTPPPVSVTFRGLLLLRPTLCSSPCARASRTHPPSRSSPRLAAKKQATLETDLESKANQTTSHRPRFCKHLRGPRSTSPKRNCTAPDHAACKLIMRPPVRSGSRQITTCLAVFAHLFTSGRPLSTSAWVIGHGCLSSPPNTWPDTRHALLLYLAHHPPHHNPRSIAHQLRQESGSRACNRPSSQGAKHMGKFRTEVIDGGGLSPKCAAPACM